MPDLTLSIILAAQNLAGTAINELKGQLEGIGGSAEKAAGGLSSLGEMAVAGFALSAGIEAVQSLGSALEGVVTNAVHFQTAMTELQNNTTLTTAQTAAAGQEILKLSATYGIATDTITTGYRHVMDIVQNAAASQEVLNVALEGAAASGADAANVANVLAGVMHEYGTDVVRAADGTTNLAQEHINASHTLGVMTAAAQDANSTLESWTGSMSAAIGIAAAGNQPLENLGAMFGSLTLHGFPDNANAGVQVKDLFVQLAHLSSGATEELMRLSKVTGVDVVGDLKRMNEGGETIITFLGQLREAFQKSGLSESEFRVESEKIIAGQRGGLGLNALLTTGYADLLRIQKDLTDQTRVNTVVDDTWNRTKDTAIKQWQILTSTVQAYSIEVGSHLLPALTPILAWFNREMPAAIDASTTALSGFITPLQGPVVAGLDALGRSMQNVMTLASQFAGTFSAQKELLGGLASSAGAELSALGGAYQQAIGGDLSGALGSVVTAFSNFDKQLAQFVASWSKSMLDWVQTMAPAFMARMGDWLGGIGDWLSGTAVPYIANLMPQLATQFVDWVAQVGPMLLDRLISIDTAIAGWITTTAGWLSGRFGEWATAFWSWIPGVVSPMLANLQDMLGQIGGWLSGTALPFLQVHTGEWASAFTDWIGQVAPPVLAGLGSMLSAIGDWTTGTALPFIATNVGTWAGAFTDWVSSVAPPILSALGDLLTQIGDWITGTAFPFITERVGTWTGAFVDWVALVSPDVMGTLGDFLGTLGDWMQGTALPFIGDHAGEWGGALVDWVREILPTVSSALGGVLSTIVDWMQSVALPSIQRHALEWATAFSDWVAPIAGRLLASLGSLLGAVGTWMTGTALPFIAAHIQGWTTPIIAWAAAVTPPFLASLGRLLVSFGTWFQSVLPTIAGYLGAWATAFANWAISIAPSVIGSLGSLVGSLANWFTGTALPVITQHLTDWASAFVDWLGPRVPDILASLGNLIGNIAGWMVGTALPTIVDHLTAWGSAFVEWVGPQIPGMLAALGNLVSRAADWIWNIGLPAIRDHLVAWGSAFVNWVSPMIGPMLEALGGLLAQLGDWTWNVGLPWLGTHLLEWGKAFVDWVAPRIPEALTALGDLLTQIGDWTWNVALPWLGTHLVEWGTAFVQWVVDVTPSVLAELQTMIEGVFKWIADQAPSLAAAVKAWATEFAGWVATTTPVLMVNLQAMIGTVFKWIADQAPSLKIAVTAWSNALGDWVTDAGPYMLGKLARLGVDFIQWINDQAKALAHALVSWAHAFGDWITGEGKKSLDQAGSDLATTIYNGLIDDIANWPIKLGNAITDAVQKAIANFRAGYNGTPDTNAQAQAQTTAGRTPVPGSYEAQAVTAAQAAGIDPATFVAQMQQESGLSPTNPDGSVKVSRAGAIGIAQFMPGTAASMGVDPTDAAASLIAAAQLDRANLDKYQGDVDKMLAAYNAGGGNVDKYGGVPPFAETQSYVSSIKANAAINPINAAGGVGTSSAAYGPTPLGWNQDQVIANPAGFDVNMATARALCGPTAYAMIEAALGRPPTVAEAIAANKSWSTAGEGGFAAFLQALASAGNVSTSVQFNPSAGVGVGAGGAPSSDALAAFAQSVGSGAMGTISTPGHYFQASGYNADTQKFNVGDTGAVVGGGQEMTLAEMQAREGAITGLVTETNALGTAAQTVLGGTLPQSLAVSDAAVQLFADKFNVSWGVARTDLTQIENGAKGTLGTVLPGQFSVTDQAVEDFSNKWGTTWDDARAILTTGSAAINTSLNTMATSVDTTGTAYQQTAQDISGALGVTDKDVEAFAALHNTTWDDARDQMNASASVYGTDAQSISKAFGVTDIAVETFAALHKTTWDDARAKLNEMVSVYGADSTQVSAAFGITDKAVEAFAKLHNTTWDDARKKLNEAAVNAGSVLGDGGQIPKAAGATIKSFGDIGTAASGVPTPLSQMKDAAAKLNTDGFTPATTGANNLANAIKSIPTQWTSTITTNFSGSSPPISQAAGNASYANSIAALGKDTGSTNFNPASSSGSASSSDSHASPFGASTIGSSGPGGKYNDPSTGQPYTHALGGVTTGPIFGMDSNGGNHVAGEAGPEAIIPLGDYLVSHKSDAVNGLDASHMRQFAEAIGATLTTAIPAAFGINAASKALPVEVVPTMDSGSVQNVSAAPTSAVNAAATLATQTATVLAQIVQSVPSLIGRAQDLLAGLAKVPADTTVNVHTDAGQVALTQLAATLTSLPHVTTLSVQTDAALADVTLAHLADTFRAVPRSIPISVQLDTVGATASSAALATQLAAMPHAIPIGVALDTKAAGDTLKGFSDQLAAVPRQVAVSVHADQSPSPVPYGDIHMPSSSGGGGGSSSSSNASGSSTMRLHPDDIAAIVHALQGVSLSVGVDTIHTELLKKSKRGPLGL